MKTTDRLLLHSQLFSSQIAYHGWRNTDLFNPIRTGGCFPPVSKFFANNFGSNKATQSKLGDFLKFNAK